MAKASYRVVVDCHRRFDEFTIVRGRHRFTLCGGKLKRNERGIKLIEKPRFSMNKKVVRLQSEASVLHKLFSTAKHRNLVFFNGVKGGFQVKLC